MSAPERHPWTFTAPWYRAPASTARGTTPIFEMFDSSMFVSDFLGDPQSDLDPVSGVDDAVSSLDGARVRKIFLGPHARFYLVVCELHCDVAGLPPVTKERPREARFVVRRVVAAAAGQVRSIEARRGAARVESAALAKKIGSFEPRATTPLAERRAARDAGLADFVRARAELEGARRDALAHLVRRRRSPSALVEQAWLVAGEGASELGDWHEATTESRPMLGETSFPLYPLIPDPRDTQHAGRGRSIYFGVVPTGTRELDPFGGPRFDDQHEYQIRCFARQPSPLCPDHPADDALYMSAPTQRFRLAAYFDPIGSTNRPTTISMPDSGVLTALAAPGAPWQARAGGVRVQSNDPETNVLAGWDAAKMQPTIQAGGPAAPAGSRGPALTCVYPLPVLTIVAAFVFKIAFAILMLLFWPLALLAKVKFCFPTSGGPGIARTAPATRSPRR